MNQVIRATNIAIAATCLMFILLLFVTKIIKEDRRPTSNLLMGMIQSQMVVMILLILENTVCVNGKNRPLYLTLILLDFMLTYFSVGLYYLYLSVYISGIKQKPRRRWDRKTYLIVGIYTVIIAIVFLSSVWTGWFYTVDSNNVPHYTIWYGVVYLMGSVWSILVVWKVICEREVIGLKNVYLTLTYIFVPSILLVTDRLYGLCIGYASIPLFLYVIFMQVEIAQEKRMLENQASLAKKEAQMTDLQMELMMSQIQPHFLYNTLSSIAWLCSDNPAEAEKATNEFASYLKGNLRFIGDKRPIPFETELSNVENYLNIEKRRFPKRLLVEYHIQTRDFSIPALTLQTLVENAVRYGVSARFEPTTVKIIAEEHQDEYRVIIDDDGPGFEATKNSATHDARRHIGISSARYRLKEMVGGTIEIDSEPGKGTKVTIHIPKERVL